MLNDIRRSGDALLRNELEHAEHSLWTADLSNFPLHPDERCVAEVLLGPRAAFRIHQIVLGYPLAFTFVGISLHVLGIGSMGIWFIDVRDQEHNGKISPIDYVWTVCMPLACVWYLLIFAVCIRGFIKVLLTQFKPLYILSNAAIFSVATFSYFFPSRGYHELTGKLFDVCAFTSIALSDAIPDPLRHHFHRYFLSSFVVLYAAVVFPRLYLDVDKHAKVQCLEFGTERLCNTTLACQILINLLIWFVYIIVCSFSYPDSFHLLLARVSVKDGVRDKSMFVRDSTSLPSILTSA